MKDKIIELLCVSFFSALLAVVLPVYYPLHNYLSPIIGSTAGALIGFVIATVFIKIRGYDLGNNHRGISAEQSDKKFKIFVRVSTFVFIACSVIYTIAMFKCEPIYLALSKSFKRDSFFQMIGNDWGLFICPFGFSFFSYMLSGLLLGDYIDAPFGNIAFIFISLSVALASLFQIWYSGVILGAILVLWLIVGAVHVWILD